MRGLWALLLCLFLAPLAQADAPDILKPCDCRDCLKLWKLSAEAEGKLYADRLPSALKSLQSTIDQYNSDKEFHDTFDGKKKVFFCYLLGTLEDDLSVVRDYQIPDAEKKIFGDKKNCLVGIGGSTDPLSCKIDDEMMLINEATSPCQEIHLAILAHELVHVQDCRSNKLKPTWLKQEGQSCNEAFAGKATPKPEQILAFAQQVFDTEVHAHRVESQVESLLINELNRQCAPDNYSTRMAKNPDYKEAAAFLQRARNYKYPGLKR